MRKSNRDWRCRRKGFFQKLVDRLVRRRTLLAGVFCCMLCRKAKEDLDHLFWNRHYAQAVWNSFLQEFGVSFGGSQSVRAMIEEFLLHPPFKDKWVFHGLSRCVLYLRHLG